MLPALRLRSILNHFARPSAATLKASQIVPPIRTMSSTKVETPRFPLSEVPKNMPQVQTAGLIIIGDEVLNGKTRDTNSNFFAKMCFDLGIELKRIEVIADDEEEIREAVLRMHKNYDFIATSGGIGPTHDDITYESVAKAFNLPLVYHDETIKRMEAFSKGRYDFKSQTEEQKTARLRMALFPKGQEYLFVQEDMWVPVVRVQGKVTIFPGIPALFERLLTGYVSRYIELPPASEKPYRVLIHTEMPESSIAPFLTKLADRVKKERIRVGSYPKFKVGVDVSLIGKDESRLLELAKEVEQELQGSLIAHGKIGQEADVQK
ncbi:flavin adenine dinucleotide pyrophosphatase [Sporobolomyces salmoneus]|uniref:flavin adenine dinucleotide pyrophosphatase n=1 Tax=Sporobolomyces salmoneus TaxID=183962 RepID=UPI003176901C